MGTRTSRDAGSQPCAGEVVCWTPHPRDGMRKEPAAGSGLCLPIATNGACSRRRSQEEKWYQRRQQGLVTTKRSRGAGAGGGGKRGRHDPLGGLQAPEGLPSLLPPLNLPQLQLSSSQLLGSLPMVTTMGGGAWVAARGMLTKRRALPRRARRCCRWGRSRCSRCRSGAGCWMQAACPCRASPCPYRRPSPSRAWLPRVRPRFP